MTGYLTFLAINILLWASTSTASSEMQAFVTNLTTTQIDAIVMSGTVVFAFFYNSTKNEGNYPIGWTDTFTTLLDVANVLKSTDVVLGQVDTSVERALAIQANIKNIVELRVYYPYFKDAQFRYDELIYDANRLHPDFKSKTIKQIKSFIESLNTGEYYFSPILSSALRAIENRKAFDESLAKILDTASEHANDGVQILTSASIIMSQLKIIRKQALLNETVNSVMEAQYSSFYNTIATGQCGLTNICRDAYQHLKVVACMYNVYNGHNFSLIEVYAAMKAAKSENEDKLRKIAGLPTNSELKSIDSESNMYKILYEVDKIVTKCENALNRIEETTVQFMHDSLEIHEVTTRGRLKTIQKHIDDGQPVDKIKGSLFRKYGNKYAECALSKLVRKQVNALYDKLVISLADKAKLIPSYYEVEAAPIM